MIRCPKCGTMNRDETRLCKQCGATLPQTRIWCSQCGTANPVGNVLCDHCNARLITAEEGLPLPPEPTEAGSAGVKGLSLPTVPIAEDGTPEPADLPDWLSELTGEAMGQSAAPSGDAELAEAELPDWLSGLMDESAVVSEEAAAETAPEVLPSAELPDWLSDLEIRTPDVVDDTSANEVVSEGLLDVPETEALVPEELPDWFSGFVERQSESDTAVDVPEPEAELPDWMAGFIDSEVAEPSAESEIEETAATPDWLSGMGAEVTDSVDEEDSLVPAALPDWLAGTSAGDVDTSEESSAASADWTLDQEPVEAASELPDWLGAASGSSLESEAPSPRELPSWLADAETQRVEDVGERAVPDWLSADDGVSPVPSPQPEAIQTPESLVQAEAPDWSAEPDVVEPEVETTESDLAQDAVPDWLANMPVEVESPSQTDAETLLEEQAVPDWLAGLESLDSEASPAPETAPVAAEVPDWLSGALAEEGQPIPVDEQPEAISQSEEEQLPDWLLGLAPSESEAVAEVSEPALEATPEWLSQAFVEETIPVPAKTETPSEEEALPDWLSDVVVEGGEPAATSPALFETTADQETLPDSPAGATGSFLALEGESLEQEDAQAVPDWLSGLDTATEGAGVVFTEPEPEEIPAEDGLAKADMPAWLRDVPTIADETAPKPVAPAFVSEDIAGEEDLPDEVVALEEGTVPEWLQGLEPSAQGQSLLEEGAVDGDDALTRAEVPTWVQNLRPPGTGPLPDLSEAEAATSGALTEGDSGLIRAEIPDWVQQLRPSPTDEGGISIETDVIMAPVVVEGPLSGLSGMLPAGLAVDMPVDFKGIPQPPIPESIVVQAQLWQELLEQPRSIERPVAQQRLRSGTGETTMRLIVGLVLAVVTVLGLWLGGPRWSQALTKPHIESLSAAIDALQPGDKVVVAVEYGPAEAGEMTPIAEALLRHLADKQVEVVAVSTLSEGAGLLHSLLNATSMTNHLPEDQSPYLAGASNGVALFVGESIESVDMLLVLSARAERLRWWVELNNTSNLGDAAESSPVPMGIGVSAATGPLVSPYLDNPQVQGGVIGLPDAIAYREFRGLTSDFFNSTLDALMFAHWAALGLMIFGFIYYLASGKKGSV